jgi:uncharacterized phage infection (PIP) family protein YhgE
MQDLRTLETKATRIQLRKEQLDAEKEKIEEELTALGVESVEDAEKKIANLTKEAETIEQQYNAEYERLSSELTAAEEAIA